MAHFQFTLCVTGSQVRGGAQKVKLAKVTNFSNFTAQLEELVNFTRDAPAPHVIDTIALYDSDFEEYVLIQSLVELPVKAKIRLELIPPAVAGREPAVAPQEQAAAGPRKSSPPRAQQQLPTAAPASQKSNANALGFYSEVCDDVLLPAIEDLTGVSAASLSVMLSEAFVTNSDDSHNSQVKKLQKMLQRSVEGRQQEDASRYVEALSPSALNQPGGVTTPGNSRPTSAVGNGRPQSALGGQQLFEGDGEDEDVPAARGGRKAAAPRRNKATPAATSPAAPVVPVPVAEPAENKQVNFDANQSASVQSPQRLQQPSTIAVEDCVILYCVYNGTTSQRAKAVKVNKVDPKLGPVLALLKDKFKSEVSLGYIEQDGGFYELLENEDLAIVINKVGRGGAGALQLGITLHCWAKAVQSDMELAYAHQGLSSRAVTPSGKSNRSYASSYAGSAKSRPTSAAGSKKKRGGGASEKSQADIRSPSGKLDVSGAAYTTEQLEALFEQLDLDDSGYLDKEELEKYFLATYDSMGDTNHLKKFRGFLDSCGALDDGKVSFDEFSIIVLKLSQW